MYSKWRRLTLFLGCALFHRSMASPMVFLVLPQETNVRTDFWGPTRTGSGNSSLKNSSFRSLLEYIAKAASESSVTEPSATCSSLLATYVASLSPGSQRGEIPFFVILYRLPDSRVASFLPSAK